MAAGGGGLKLSYVIVTRNRRLLEWARIAEAAEEIEDRPGLPVFTDAHHNLLRILK